MFSKLVLLLFIGNIDRLGATGTRNLIIENSAEIRMENLLIEFITDLMKFNSEIFDIHRFIILGKDEDTLQATKVLLERGTPYFIYTKVAATPLPLHISAEGVVLFFIDGLTDSEINSTFNWLPNNFKCRTLVISMDKNRTHHSITTTILSAVAMKVRNVLFARFNGLVFEIYGRMLNEHCEQEIKLLNMWIPEEGFSKNETILGHGLILNERGCHIFVSTYESPPTMILREDENKSLHISGGLEGRLVETIAEYLNMVPIVKRASASEQMWRTPNGTVLGIIGDIAREEASFGIGQIIPNLERAMLVDFTKPYNPECIVWTVPLTTRYNYSVVTSEFSFVTWIMVILSVLLCCGVAYAIPRLNMDNWTSLNVFDIIAMTLNYTISRPPTNLLCKLMFLLYLHYSRVISTAYSTSLSSILTTTRPEPAILNDEEIVAAGFRTTGSRSSFGVLVDMQIPLNDTRIELLNRYEVTSSAEEALARIADRQDTAYLRQYSTITYFAEALAMAGKPVRFSTLPDCVVAYTSVIVTPKGSRLTGEVDNIIRRIFEAGLNEHWSNLDRTSRTWTRPLGYNSNTLSRLNPIFLLYLCCLIPAFVVFAAELIAFKAKLNWFTR